MTDRRPPTLWVVEEDALPVSREPTPADLLAAVRRGVESGTIKGEVLPDATIRDKRGNYRNGDFLVVRLEDT